MRLLRYSALVVALALGAAGSARASLITVPIDSEVNYDIRINVGGNNLPVAPTTLTVGGVPFALVPFGAQPDSLGIITTLVGDSTFSISTNIFGASTVYTLINSAFGTFGAVNGRVEFVGTGGAFASFDLIQGFNIRDYFNNVFNNTVTDPTIVTADFGGGVRLDRQEFVLPSLFATETLTEIRLVGTNAGNPQGEPFLVGVTVGTAQAVPEPGSITLAAVGAGLLGCGWLRRRRASTGGLAA